jgi:2'-5' RNA ligase
MPRLFFAITTPDPIRTVLREAQEQLLELFDRDALRLEHLENSHLTLAFLGEVAESIKPLLIETASRSISDCKVDPFEMTVADLLPSDKRHPKVIWATVQPEAPIVKLHRGVVKATNAVGITVDTRPYHPHLTLARFRQPVKLEAVTFPGLPAIPATVNEVVLIESVLGYGPPKHMAIARFELPSGHVN